ncbi:Uncharacterised protein [Vibrio cholerae]|nr:Uncharacterised protein [Vibrio cholerae]
MVISTFASIIRRALSTFWSMNSKTPTRFSTRGYV